MDIFEPLRQRRVVDPKYNRYHPHVFTMIGKMPRSFHPNRPVALVEFEYVGSSPTAYSRPAESMAVNILRICCEGYRNVSPQSLSERAYNEIVNMGFKEIIDAHDDEILRSKGEHKIW